MARNNSRDPSQRTTRLPYTSDVLAPPTLHIGTGSATIATWAAQEQPLSEYTFTHQPSHLQRTSPLEQVPEFEDPMDFLRRNQSDPLSSPAVSLPLVRQRLSTSSHNLQIPSTPTTDSLTTATTLTTMSRANSLCNDSMLEGLQMMRFNSNASHTNNDHLISNQNSPFSSSHSHCSSSEEQSLLLTGLGGASSVSLISTPPFHVPSSAFAGEKMEKSQSNESVSSLSSSSSSSSSRNIKRLQELNSSAIARPLMPKGGNAEMSQWNSLQSMSQIGSKDASDKVAISKPTYTRPKHDRVFCKQCDGHPEGFRGEHELKRHQDREHKQMVKKYICVEPADGLSHPKPILPLAKCKACNQQKKKYNAYYNAAAHLRRAHFRPKPLKGRSKQNRTDDDEKRGGKGGGDWPGMKELKCWMREVEETALPLTNIEQEEADASDEEDSFNDYTFSQQTMLVNDFEHGFLPDASAFATYPNIIVNNSTCDMQVPFDFSGVQTSHCMGSSMYTNSAQNFSSFRNDSFPNDPSSMALLADTSLPILISEPDFSHEFSSNVFQ